MPQTPIYGHIGEPLNILPQVESSNNYAMARVHAGMAKHGEAYLALSQTMGKGQRGKTWLSNPGENITISYVVVPDPLEITQQFLLSAVTALACYEFLNTYTNGDCFIKWPNDLYWNDRKAGGILIENILQGSDWPYAVIGIGLNVNQTAFSKDVAKAVSLKQITGKEFDVISLAKQLGLMLDKQFQLIRTSSPAEIISAYNAVLYKKDEEARLQKNNLKFSTTIRGVSLQGTLLTSDSIDREFQFGEVKWLN